MLSYPRLQRRFAELRAVVLLSVQHTGTWFLIEFFRRHPQITSVRELRDFKTEVGVLEGRPLIQSHVTGETWDPHGRELEKFLPVNAGELTAESWGHVDALYRVVCPLRDPVKALLTRHGRHPYLDHRYIVEGFLTLARIHADSCREWTFLPIDRTGDTGTRVHMLNGLVAGAGLDPWPEGVNAWARDWPRVNSSGTTELKQAYQEEDFASVQRALPEETSLLLDSREELIPFLKDQGYTHMPWWR